MKSFLTFFVGFALFTSAFTYTREERVEILSETNPSFLNETYYAGSEPLDNGRGRLFFWLFESRRNKTEDPLVIWLTGSFGCATEIAIFAENGPFKIDKNNYSLEINPHSWTNAANLLYVDQPLGIGLSNETTPNRTKPERNKTLIVADFYTFLEEFLITFPDYNGKDFYIAGESYGAHYIPAISVHLLNKGHLNLTFQGVAIGNGAVSPLDQYPSYADYAWENKLMVTEAAYNRSKIGFKFCQNLMRKAKDRLSLTHAVLLCQSNVEKIFENPPGVMNPFDIRQIPCEHPPLCYDFTFIDNFLNQRKVIEVLRVNDRPWLDCNNINREDFLFDFIGDSNTDDLTLLLRTGLKVLIYNGDKDFVFNWRGSEAVINDLYWTGSNKFSNLNYTVIPGEGEYKQVGNFIFYKVYDAGHLVSMDQPEKALNMLERFLKGWEN